jgi:hypothetical protein
MTGPVGSWLPLGPAGIVRGQTDRIDRSGWGSAPVSGRVTAVVADPSNPDNLVYIGTALGGVWKLQVAGDGTQTWQPMIDTESVITVGALALSAAGDVLWVGTGDSALGGDAVVGRGILRITVATGAVVRYYAGGNIIGLPSNPATPPPSGLPPGLVVSRIVADPTTTDHVVAATTLGVFELTAIDGGFSEVKLQPSTGSPVSAPATDLLLDTASADPTKHQLWVAHSSVGPVLSRRAGAPSATNYLAAAPDVGLPVATGLRVVLSRCDAHPEVVYLAMATSWTSLGLWRTTSAPAGDTVPATTAWVALTPPVPSDGIRQAPYNLVLAVHPTQSDIAYLGEARLWRTTAGGVSGGGANPWEQCGKVTTSSQGIHWDQHTLFIDPRFGTAGTFDGIRLWAGNDGGIWRSVDGGTSFGSRNRGLQTLQFFQVVSHPTARPVVVAGAQDNGVLRSDGSGSWLEIAQGDGCYVSIDPGQPSTWYEGYVSYSGLRNDPDFAGFTGIKRSTSSGAVDSFSIVAGPSPTRAGTTDSIDPGDDALFYAPFILIPSASAGTAGELWVGTDRLYRSGDRGDHWQQVGPVLAPRPAGNAPSTGRGVSAVACAPGHPERIYAGTSEGRLFRFDQPPGGSWPTGAALAVTELTAQPPPGGSPPGTPPVNALAQADATLAGRFISDIAVTRVGADDQVVVALGLNHITGGTGTVPLPGAASLAISENSGGTFTKVVVDTLTFADGSTLDGLHNYANAVAIDPQQASLIYIGCDVGVFRYQTGVDPSPQAFNQGLPNAPVLDLDIWPRQGSGSPKLLRAATHGRGIFEADLDATGAKSAEVYLRDMVVDDGRDPVTPATAPDPFGSDTLSATATPDAKIESSYFFRGTPTRASTTDYTPTGPLDFIGFAQLNEGGLVGGRDATVWVQAHNRGPQPATNVAVRAYWATKTSGSLPALPGGFWTGFPTSDPPGPDWKALGPAVTIPVLRAGEPAMVSWSWTLPGSGSGSDLGLLVAVTSTEDPFVAPPATDATQAAEQSRFVAYRDVSMGIPEWELIALIVLGLGLGAGIVYAATR